MGDYPTLRTPWHFSSKNFCGTKRCLVVNLQIDSTEEEEVEPETELQVQEEDTLEIYTSESSTVQDEKVNKSTTLVFFSLKKTKQKINLKLYLLVVLISLFGKVITTHSRLHKKNLAS
jgi:hypothetical protein